MRPILECVTQHVAQRFPLQWRRNERDGVSNHQPHECFFNRSFRRRSKKTSKLRVTGLCAGNSPETGEFPAQMASNGENVSIWWRHHGFSSRLYMNTYLQVYSRILNLVYIEPRSTKHEHGRKLWIEAVVLKFTVTSFGYYLVYMRVPTLEDLLC